jgi:nucleotidyltransferase/DNA polymerase involved in DNA repair
MLLCVDVAANWVETEPQCLALWEEMLDALDAVSPLIDDAGLGLAFLDMHGIGDGALAWMAQTRALLARFGHASRLGVGSNKIAALAAAHVGDGTICEPGTESEMLAPLPLELLGIEPETIERLRLLGIERLGELAHLPHGPFARRFGAPAAAWHELARGVDRRPFTPRAHTIAIEASIFGEGRASDETQVFFALRMLLGRICADLDCCGRRAGALRLSVELEDADACDFDVPLAIPTAHERTMFDMLRAKLEGATFGAAIVGLRLQALQLEEGGEAQAFFSADDFDSQRVAVTIARLEAVLGEEIARAKTREAHLLEERYVYEPFRLNRSERSDADLSQVEQGRGTVPQLRLLEVREVPVQLRGGEPAIVDRRTVRQCTGPWRIAERPFIPSPVMRDEYDVVLEDGTFARIYRQGSYWYLRGIYE